MKLVVMGQQILDALELLTGLTSCAVVRELAPAVVPFVDWTGVLPVVSNLLGRRGLKILTAVANESPFVVITT